MLHYRTECDGWRLVHRIYCSAHQTSINNVFWAIAFETFFDLPHVTTGTWLWKFILLFIMAEDAYIRTKQWAEWGLSMTVRRLHRKHWSEQIHANKHTLKLYGSTSLTLFLSYSVLQASLEEKEAFFASRHLPEKVTVHEKYGLLY